MVDTTLTGYSILCMAIKLLVRFGNIDYISFNNVKCFKNIEYNNFNSNERYHVPGTKVREVYKVSGKFLESACFAMTM